MIWNILKFKKLYLLFSVLVLIPGVISLILFRLNLAVDFTGGTVLKYDLSKQTDYDQNKIKEDIHAIFEKFDLKTNYIIIDAQNLEIRTKIIDSVINDKLNTEIKVAYPDITQKSFESIGPSVGKETTRKAFIALGLACVAILIYISIVFRDIPKPYSSFRFGTSAIIAMLHDALLLLGLFSILGKVYKVEVDSLFITAMLTVIGFSIHDSIVVFDRIRENLKKLSSSNFEQVVNYSIVETLNRSFATSLTVLMTLLSLYILGGESIRYFVLALLVGIVSGTYSSIFTAGPILVIWEEYILKKKRTKN